MTSLDGATPGPLRFSLTKQYDDDDDLNKLRRQNDARFKSRFDSIIEKYNRDFSSVADVIDLATEEIVVDKGHLRSMRHDRDIGRHSHQLRRSTPHPTPRTLPKRDEPSPSSSIPSLRTPTFTSHGMTMDTAALEALGKSIAQQMGPILAAQWAQIMQPGSKMPQPIDASAPRSPVRARLSSSIPPVALSPTSSSNGSDAERRTLLERFSSPTNQDNTPALPRERSPQREESVDLDEERLTDAFIPSIWGGAGPKPIVRRQRASTSDADGGDSENPQSRRRAKSLVLGSPNRRRSGSVQPMKRPPNEGGWTDIHHKRSFEEWEDKAIVYWKTKGLTYREISERLKRPIGGLTSRWYTTLKAEYDNGLWEVDTMEEPMPDFVSSTAETKKMSLRRAKRQASVLPSLADTTTLERPQKLPRREVSTELDSVLLVIPDSCDSDEEWEAPQGCKKSIIRRSPYPTRAQTIESPSLHQEADLTVLNSPQPMAQTVESSPLKATSGPLMPGKSRTRAQNVGPDSKEPENCMSRPGWLREGHPALSPKPVEGRRRYRRSIKPSNRPKSLVVKLKLKMPSNHYQSLQKIVEENEEDVSITTDPPQRALNRPVPAEPKPLMPALPITSSHRAPSFEKPKSILKSTQLRKRTSKIRFDLGEQDELSF